MVPAELNGGYIFDIQGFSVHDGPGCRTLIFFKGCSLHCAWCSNPEGIAPYPEPLYNIEKCNSDLLCVEACPFQAILIDDGRLSFYRVKCSTCTTFDCARACCTAAIRIGGYHTLIDDIYGKIQRDRQYWGDKGGITLTGGEPFFQPGFAKALLKKCFEGFIHTAVETCGNVPWRNIGPSLPWLDWIFYDLKHMDPDKHKSATGHSNKLILENALKLSEKFSGRMVFRMPVIPGFNDDDDHVQEMAAFIRSTGRNEINLLPVHHLGREKYPLSGRIYSMDPETVMNDAGMQRVQSIFKTEGVKCYIGSDTPF
jgi:pyruvate formate lyase activating enzyme